MRDIFDLIIVYLNKIKGLTIYGWLATYFTALLSPLASMALPIILLVVLDIITGIKASQFEEQTKNVVRSKKWQDKMRLMTPFLIGLIACRITEHSLTGSLDISLLGIEIKNVLTTMWAGLFFINELISILENVSRMGYKNADPIINFLRIKKSEVEKFGEKTDETKK